MKYKLTDETMTTESGVVLHRIECVNAFYDVNVGEKGGWVEREGNLSQYNNCWLYGDACVCGNAFVFGNAHVFGDARVCGNAQVYGDAQVCGNAQVYGDAQVFENAQVFGDARVFENACVCGYARVFENACVWGYAQVYQNARVYGHAVVYGNAMVYGNAQVCGKSVIKNNGDYIVFKNNWSSGRYFTWTRSNEMWRVGCFYGSGQELIEKAYKDSKLSGDCYKAYVELVEKLKEIQK